MKRWKYTTATFVTVVVCWVVYALLTFFAPESASSAHFNLHGFQRALIDLTVLLPIHLIWLLAAYGITRFKTYAAMLKDSAEGRAFNLIADGLLVSLGYFIVSSIFNGLMPFFDHNTPSDAIIIIRDHIAPIFSLVAFYLLYRGSSNLRQVAPFDTWTTATFWWLIAYVLFTAVFVFTFTTAPGGVPASRTAADVMPHGVLIFTLILPFLAAWFMGLLSCINITKYASHVKGTLYRKALRDLVIGISGIAIFAIILQLLGFADRYLSNLSLGPILAILYMLLVLYGVGFIFVAAGAKKLARFEAVK